MNYLSLRSITFILLTLGLQIVGLRIYSQIFYQVIFRCSIIQFCLILLRLSVLNIDLHRYLRESGSIFLPYLLPVANLLFNENLSKHYTIQRVSNIDVNPLCKASAQVENSLQDSLPTNTSNSNQLRMNEVSGGSAYFYQLVKRSSDSTPSFLERSTGNKGDDVAYFFFSP